MAWENQGWQTEGAVDAILTSESQSAFMARVYRWMFAGLALTGVIALYTVSNEALLMQVLQWRFGLLLAQLGAVLALSWLAPRLPGAVAAALFLGYAALSGLTFAIYFLIYTRDSIGEAFLITAGAFAALSAYATFTKKDLSAWGTFLMMGLFGVVIAGVVQLFWSSPGFSFVWSCCCVVVFAGLTAYDTQKLRQMHAAIGYQSVATASIVGALVLYLDFVNLFLALLRLMGRRR